MLQALLMMPIVGPLLAGAQAVLVMVQSVVERLPGSVASRASNYIVAWLALLLITQLHGTSAGCS